MRSTRTWSPISRVFTIEAEGISKFWKIKVITKRPMASTLQIEASDSSGVSVRSTSVVFTSFAAGSIVSIKPVSTSTCASVSETLPDASDAAQAFAYFGLFGGEGFRGRAALAHGFIHDDGSGDGDVERRDLAG